jgi:hypothetical protein
MKRVPTFLVTVAFLAFAGTAAARAQSEVMVSLGRGADNADIDVASICTPPRSGARTRRDAHVHFV